MIVTNILSTSLGFSYPSTRSNDYHRIYGGVQLGEIFDEVSKIIADLLQCG